MIVLIAIAVVIAVHIVSMLTLDRSIEYKEEQYFSEALPASLEGYTIAFVSDTHAIKPQAAKQMTERINQRQPDLLLLGGDMADANGSYGIMDILADVNAQDGTYGVDGNHDKLSKLSNAMQRNGMISLQNSGASPRDGLYIAGVKDVYKHTPNPQKALQNKKQGDFALLLAHNPDVSADYDTTGAQLILSGHTHGGQATLFGLWAPALSRFLSVSKYGQRFMQGWAKGDFGSDVYVSRGVGSFHIIPRIFARPQVIFFTLHKKN